VRPLAERSDVELLRAAAGGDGHAFATFYDRHAEPVFGYCRRIADDDHDAADAAQEAFLGVLTRAHADPDAIAEPAAYLFRAARNAALRGVSARRRVRAVDEVPEPPREMASPRLEGEAKVLTENLQATVRAANRELPVRQREVLALREVEELSYEEIGARMELSANAAAQLAWRARGRFRSLVRRDALGQIRIATRECERAMTLTTLLEDGPIDAADAEWLDDHLDDCEHCRASRALMAEAGTTYRLWAPAAALVEMSREGLLARAGEIVGADWTGLGPAGAVGTEPQGGRRGGAAVLLAALAALVLAAGAGALLLSAAGGGGGGAGAGAGAGAGGGGGAGASAGAGGGGGAGAGAGAGGGAGAGAGAGSGAGRGGAAGDGARGGVAGGAGGGGLATTPPVLAGVIGGGGGGGGGGAGGAGGAPPGGAGPGAPDPGGVTGSAPSRDGDTVPPPAEPTPPPPTPGIAAPAPDAAPLPPLTPTPVTPPAPPALPPLTPLPVLPPDDDPPTPPGRPPGGPPAPPPTGLGGTRPGMGGGSSGDRPAGGTPPRGAGVGRRRDRVRTPPGLGGPPPGPPAPSPPTPPAPVVPVEPTPPPAAPEPAACGAPPGHGKASGSATGRRICPPGLRGRDRR
jgi:RNA polymerase sigma factor (sigma-70 family)